MKKNDVLWFLAEMFKGQGYKADCYYLNCNVF